MRNTQIPSSLNILGTEFKVTVRKLKERDLCGYTDIVKREISVDSSMAADAQIETFYHEVVHAIIGLAGYSSILGDDVEEALAQHLGYALLCFLSENSPLPKRRRKS